MIGLAVSVVVVLALLVLVFAVANKESRKVPAAPTTAHVDNHLGGLSPRQIEKQTDSQMVRPLLPDGRTHASDANDCAFINGQCPKKKGEGLGRV